MRAKLRFISGAGFDWEQYMPESASNFSICLEVGVAFTDSAATELFQVQVCSPQWIEEHFDGKDSIWPVGMLLVRRFSHDLVISEIKRIISLASGSNLIEVSKKVGKYMISEFDQ